MKQEEVQKWRNYLEAKKRRGKPTFILSHGMYGLPSMSNRGHYLDLYDVELRYKFGGNKAIHKYIEYDYR
jgi:hypothetical protein